MQSKEDLLKNVYIKYGVKEDLLDTIYKNLIENKQKCYNISFIFGAKALKGLVESKENEASAIITTDSGELIIFTENHMVEIPLKSIKNMKHVSNEKQMMESIYQGNSSNDVISLEVIRKENKKSVQRIILKDKSRSRQNDAKMLFETFQKKLDKSISSSKVNSYEPMSDITVTGIENTLNDSRKTSNKNTNYRAMNETKKLLNDLKSLAISLGLLSFLVAGFYLYQFFGEDWDSFALAIIFGSLLLSATFMELVHAILTFKHQNN